MGRDGSTGNSPNMTAIKLEFSNGQPPVTDVGDINRRLRPIGAGVWPIDFRGVPPEIRGLMKQTRLTSEEREKLKQHFLLSREQLLRIIADAGREPHVPGGGEMSTYVVSDDYWYPQLHFVEDGVDYSRFDRFHINVADDGTGTDEVAQLLAGGAVVIHHQQPDRKVLTLSIHCGSEDHGWLVTHTGDRPHIGSVSQAVPGTKLLVQVIGPPRWSIKYVDGE
jgi:hypothetical protein